MFRRRADAKFQIKVRYGFGAFDRNGVIVKRRNRFDLPGVVIIIPGCHNMFRAHECQGIQIVPGGNRHPVRPPGIWIELKIHGLFIRGIGPVGGKLGNNTPRDRMDINQSELVVQNCASKRAVGIRSHHPEGHGKIHDGLPDHPAFFSIVRGKHRICIIGEPQDIVRQFLIHQGHKACIGRRF